MLAPSTRKLSPRNSRKYTKANDKKAKVHVAVYLMN